MCVCVCVLKAMINKKVSTDRNKKTLYTRMDHFLKLLLFKKKTND